MPPAGLPELQIMVNKIFQLLVAGAFVALLIMLVVAGIKYITSGGEPKPLTSASQTITWTILGILFLALAWLILKLIEAFTGVNLTTFCLGLPGTQFCP